MVRRSHLTRYTDAIATRTGIGQAAIGVLLLGSAGINVLLLALADAALGRGALTSTPASPGVLLQGALSVLLLVLVAGAVVAGERLCSGWESAAG